MTRATVFGVVIGVALAGNVYGQQTIASCQVLPSNNIWNTPIDTLPVLSNSTSMVNTIGATRGFHADFGAGTWDGGPIGIPFITVSGSQTKYLASFLYADESDAGPYAVPLNAPIEGGSGSTGDRHAIAIDTDNCILYELYRAFPGTSDWTADSGAIFDLKSNVLRPSTWTSADAAGLPIMPGL
jgi:spore coat protein U-like protein